MVYFATHGGPVSAAATAAPGQAGRRVRVRRLFISSDSNGALDVVQDPGGADTRILPSLQVRSGGTVLNLAFTREFPIGGVGQAVGYLATMTGVYGLWIEYEYVS